MRITRLALSVVASVTILAGVAAAQDAGGAQEGRPSPQAEVTAGASDSGVRFVSTGGTRRIRLEVYTAAGERLFDSDFRAGSILDWVVGGERLRRGARGGRRADHERRQPHRGHRRGQQGLR